MQTAKFWMVIRSTPYGGNPKVRHATRAAAYAEAERLSRKENANFIVLEALDEVISIPQPPDILRVKVETKIEVPRPPKTEWRRVRYRDPGDPEQVDTSTKVIPYTIKPIPQPAAVESPF